MNTVKLDLIEDNAINIGATFQKEIQLCNFPDLTEYTGLSQIRLSNTSDTVILSPTITVITKDIFKIVIPYTAYNNVTVEAGNYVYDVLFSKTDDRFYAVGGKAQLIRRVTTVI